MTAAAAQTTTNATPPPAIAGELEDLRDDVATALTEQGFKPADARKAAGQVSGKDFSSMFREALMWLRSIHAVPASTTRKKRTATAEAIRLTPDPPDPPPAPTKRTCEGFGGKPCGNPLETKNTSGKCKRCYARMIYHKNGRHGKAVSQILAQETAPAGRFPVLLSEQQISRFLEELHADWKAFVRMLPPELKLALVNHYFANNLDENEVRA